MLDQARVQRARPAIRPVERVRRQRGELVIATLGVALWHTTPRVNSNHACATDYTYHVMVVNLMVVNLTSRLNRITFRVLLGRYGKNTKAGMQLAKSGPGSGVLVLSTYCAWAPHLEDREGGGLQRGGLFSRRPHLQARPQPQHLPLRQRWPILRAGTQVVSR